MGMTIDNIGNIVEGGVFVGYVDSITKKCYLFDDSGDFEINCPENGDFSQPVKESKRTYWWILFIVLAVLIIGLGIFLNTRK